MEEKLIIAVAAHPELYDMSCPLYKDRRKKDQAWVSISQELGEPMERCRTKWKSLRDTYTKERKKFPKSGAAAGTGRKWKYLGVLSFLDPFIAPRATSGNMEQGVEEDWTPQSRESEEEGETAGPSQREEEFPEEEPAVSTPAPPTSPTPGPSSSAPAAAPASLVSPRSGRKRTKRVQEDEEPRNWEIQRLLSSELQEHRDQRKKLNQQDQPHPPAPQPVRSEDQLFLDSLAPSLEKLEPQVKALVKFQIHKLIYEASTVVLNLEPAE